MKQYRIVIEETRYHYYDVVANTKEEAVEKVEEVYYNDNEDKTVVKIDEGNGENNIIEVVENE